jgi:hypothetical protein
VDGCPKAEVAGWAGVDDWPNADCPNPAAGLPNPDWPNALPAAGVVVVEFPNPPAVLPNALAAGVVVGLLLPNALVAGVVVLLPKALVAGVVVLPNALAAAPKPPGFWPNVLCPNAEPTCGVEVCPNALCPNPPVAVVAGLPNALCPKPAPAAGVVVEPDPKPPLWLFCPNELVPNALPAGFWPNVLCPNAEPA